MRKKVYYAIVLAMLLQVCCAEICYAAVSTTERMDNDGINIGDAIESTDEVEQVTSVSSLPECYSSVSCGYVTSIKEQGDYGSCWSFSTIAAIESSLIKNNAAPNTINLSEFQLLYFSFNRATGTSFIDELGNTQGDKIIVNNGDYRKIGGNNFLALFTLAQGVGLSKESIMPYSKIGNNTTYQGSLAYNNKYAYFQDGCMIEMSDTNAIKDAIINYAAVSTSYNHDFNNYNEAYASYYSNQANLSSNHAITIVGWDDNFSNEKFAVKPSKNGAWLCKNSWGTDSGDNGYIWISYQDVTLNDSQAIFYNFDLSDDYYHRYQYDGTSSITYYSDVNKVANVFTTKYDEGIDSIMFATYEPDITYSIYIYTDLKSSNPESGILKASLLNNKMEYIGYHTVELGKTVKVPEGEKFSVVINMSKDNEGVNALVDSESDWGFVQFISSAEEGQSYIYKDTSGWADIGKIDVNCRIKALTKNVTINKTTVINSIDSNLQSPQITGNEVMFTIDGENEVSELEYKISVFDSDNNEVMKSDYSKDNKQIVSVNSPGTYQIKVYVKDKYNVEVMKQVEYVFVKPKLLPDVVIEKSELVTKGDSINIIAQAYENEQDDVFDENIIDNSYSLSLPNEDANNTEEESEDENQKIEYRFEVWSSDNELIYESDYSTNSECIWNTNEASIGKYKIVVTVKDSDGNIETIVKYVEVVNTITPTVKGSLVSPQEINSTVVFTTSTSGGVSPYQYKYVVNNKTIQDYGSKNTFKYKFESAGTFAIKVYVKDSRGEEVIKNISYKIYNKLEINGINTSIKSPQLYTSKVTITPSISGGNGTYYYRYLIKDSNGKVVKDTGFVVNQKNFTWTPSKASTYTIYCGIMNDTKFVYYYNIKYVANTKIALKTVSTSRVLSSQKALRIKFTPTVSGGINGKKYKYIVYNSSGKQIATRNYSTTSNYYWTPGSAGKYSIKCYVKDNSGYSSTKTISYTVNSSLSISSISKSSICNNGKALCVSFSNTVSGGINSYRYKYVIKNSSGKTLATRSYSATKTYVWTPSKTGTYKVTCYVKDSKGIIKSKTISFKVSSNLSISKVSASLVSPQKKNKIIKFTPTVKGGIKNYSYKYVVKKSTGKVTATRSYKTTRTLSWKPTCTGTYYVTCYVKDTMGKVKLKTIKYVIN